MKIADVIITDYSACEFEASVLLKPLYFFVPDYDEYSSERGINVDLKKEMPSATFENAEELVNAIKLNNYDFDIDLCEQVNVKYQSGVIFANVNNAQIEINKKYVVINKNLCYQRKTKYIYDNNDDTIISIRK